MNIPEAAVEAAAEAHCEGTMRAALEAAAPFIAAQALEDAADDYRHYEQPNARLYLRHRADQIRVPGD